MTNIRKAEAFLRERFANCTYLHDVSYHIFLSVVIGIGTIHLTGCGSDFATEPTETAIISDTDSEEDNTTEAETDTPVLEEKEEETPSQIFLTDSEEDNITEAETDTPVLEENEEETPSQISLMDITWKDYNDGAYETFLYFSFSNGSVVDRELQYSGIVKNIEYRDITGDGEDEVIVYRDMVNNVHDNYMLVDFFRIEADTVTEISPSVDIPELSNNPCDTEVVSNYTEEYAIVLRMEDYGKTGGILYTKMEMTIGFDKERWRVIKKQEIPDWKLAYLDDLATNIDLISNGLFWLAYLDGDETPELFFCEDDTQITVSVLTCENGEAKELEYHFQGGELTEYGNGMNFDELYSILGSANNDEW